MSVKLFKNVTNFLGDKKSRPILQCIHFSNDGNIYATNSHIAIMVEDYNMTETSFSLNPKTLEQTLNEYPSIKNLIPDKGSHELELDLNQIKSLVTYLKSFKKEQAKLIFTQNKLSFIINDQEFNIFVPFKENEEFIIHFNVNYLLIALQTFLDEGTNVTLLLQTAVRPILFYTSNIKILVTPVRVKE